MRLYYGYEEGTGELAKCFFNNDRKTGGQGKTGGLENRGTGSMFCDQQIYF